LPEGSRFIFLLKFTFTKPVSLAGCDSGEKKCKKTVARRMNLRTIRRPVCNGTAAVDAIVHSETARANEHGILIFDRCEKKVELWGCANKSGRYYRPPCSKHAGGF
jgi:hypothetical protein